jgi:hypothetical protein
VQSESWLQYSPHFVASQLKWVHTLSRVSLRHISAVSFRTRMSANGFPNKMYELRTTRLADFVLFDLIALTLFVTGQIAKISC